MKPITRARFVLGWGVVALLSSAWTMIRGPVYLFSEKPISSADFVIQRFVLCPIICVIAVRCIIQSVGKLRA